MIENKIKNRLPIQLFAWLLIIGSALVLLKTLFIHKGYYYLFNLYFLTKDFNPPVDFNFGLQAFFAILELVVAVTVFISAVYVLKFKDFWRKILTYSIGVSILLVLFAPKIILFPQSFLIIVSLFLISVIVLLNKREVKELFS